MALKRPIEKFFLVPNNVCEILAPMTRTQILALLYTVRHTFGVYDDEQEPQRLSFNDFLHGRETRNEQTGELESMDTGCGVSAKSTLSDALRGLALEHHLILIIEDRWDGGRITKSYRIRTTQDKGYPDIIDLDEYTVLRANERKLVSRLADQPDFDISWLQFSSDEERT